MVKGVMPDYNPQGEDVPHGMDVNQVANEFHDSYADKLHGMIAPLAGRFTGTMTPELLRKALSIASTYSADMAQYVAGMNGSASDQVRNNLAVMRSQQSPDFLNRWAFDNAAKASETAKNNASTGLMMLEPGYKERELAQKDKEIDNTKEKAGLMGEMAALKAGNEARRTDATEKRISLMEEAAAKKAEQDAKKEEATAKKEARQRENDFRKNMQDLMPEWSPKTGKGGSSVSAERDALRGGNAGTGAKGISVDDLDKIDRIAKSVGYDNPEDAYAVLGLPTRAEIESYNAPITSPGDVPAGDNRLGPGGVMGSPAGTAPATIQPPEGAQPTGKTIGGKPAYLLPSGQYWTP